MKSKLFFLMAGIFLFNIFLIPVTNTFAEQGDAGSEVKKPVLSREEMVYLAQAQIAKKSGDWEIVFKAGEKITELKPNDPKGYLIMLEAAMRTKQVELALSTALKAKMNKVYHEALLRVHAEVIFMAGGLLPAIEPLERIEEILSEKQKNDLLNVSPSAAQ